MCHHRPALSGGAVHSFAPLSPPLPSFSLDAAHPSLFSQQSTGYSNAVPSQLSAYGSNIPASEPAINNRAWGHLNALNSLATQPALTAPASPVLHNYSTAANNYAAASTQPTGYTAFSTQPSSTSQFGNPSANVAVAPATFQTSNAFQLPAAATSNTSSNLFAGANAGAGNTGWGNAAMNTGFNSNYGGLAAPAASNSNAFTANSGFSNVFNTGAANTTTFGNGVIPATNNFNTGYGALGSSNTAVNTQPYQTAAGTAFTTNLFQQSAFQQPSASNTAFGFANSATQPQPSAFNAFANPAAQNSSPSGWNNYSAAGAPINYSNMNSSTVFNSGLNPAAASTDGFGAVNSGPQPSAFGMSGNSAHSFGTRQHPFVTRIERDVANPGMILRYHHIGCMSQYEMKSAEELRWEDVNVAAQQRISSGMMQPQASYSVFGSNMPASNSVFGNVAATPSVFGSQAAFGVPSAAPNQSAFGFGGAPAAFGVNANNNWNNAFGFGGAAPINNAQPTPFTFGSPVQNNASSFNNTIAGTSPFINQSNTFNGSPGWFNQMPSQQQLLQQQALLEEQQRLAILMQPRIATVDADPFGIEEVPMLHDAAVVVAQQASEEQSSSSEEPQVEEPESPPLRASSAVLASPALSRQLSAASPQRTSSMPNHALATLSPHLSPLPSSRTSSINRLLFSSTLADPSAGSSPSLSPALAALQPPAAASAPATPYRRPRFKPRSCGTYGSLSPPAFSSSSSHASATFLSPALASHRLTHISPPPVVDI